eukprot:TRINITY_DN17864_c0_g1_i1.p1 TRINITY_DN17864_c0_g1~~TRINITY_DN17864_c0_g1_i1.p1  ORF type:complete len:290 (+),score=54.76 TRINITY_DN17864_c0_g1_i1:77-871(+)
MKQSNKGGGSNNQHNPNKSNQKKPAATPSKLPTPQQIKQEKEATQKKALEEHVKKVEDDIRKHEHEKKALNQGLDKTFSLVMDKLNNLNKVADLSKHWISDIGFLQFLPQDNSPDGEEVVLHQNNDLSSLLKMDFKHFWCQVVFDPSFLIFADSYLRYSERSYAQFSLDPCDSFLDKEDAFNTRENINQHQQALLQRVFATLVRMSTHQETTSQHMTRPYYADLIYDKQLWDVPKIMDFCVLYGARNRLKVEEVVHRLFEIQPK